MENKFYKIMQSGGTYISATFYNPITKETKSYCVRDYDYEDCSRDNDELYYEPINEDVLKIYLHDNNFICVDDTIKVIKGRKVKIGTISKVIKKYPVKDKYGREVATYLLLESGERINETNCVLFNDEE